MNKVCIHCGHDFEPPAQYQENQYCKGCYLKLRGATPLPPSRPKESRAIQFQALLKSLIQKKGLKCSKELIMKEAEFYFDSIERLI